MERRIYELMREAHISGEIVINNGNMVAIEVFWGDWKHQHLRLDWLMEEAFSNIKNIFEEVTESDGSDCYSAIHYYYFS